MTLSNLRVANDITDFLSEKREKAYCFADYANDLWIHQIYMFGYHTNNMVDV